MENIFWAAGTAPVGLYRYWVFLANKSGILPSDQYYLRVILKNEVVLEHRGSVADLRDQPLLGQVSVGP